MGYVEDRYRQRLERNCCLARELGRPPRRPVWERIGISHEAYDRMVAGGQKWCPKCMTWLDRGTSFHRDRARRDGLSLWCKACHARRRR